MRELSKSRLEKWLIACWSLLFLWGWGDFCCRVLRDWHAMSSGARTNAFLFLLFALALLLQLVKNKSPWLMVMTAAMLFGTAAYLSTNL